MEQFWRCDFEHGVVDTHKNQNLELFLGAADFHFRLSTQNVP